MTKQMLELRVKSLIEGGTGIRSEMKQI